MRIALLAPGFSKSKDDWAIPALQSFAAALAREHDLSVFSLRYPAEGRYSFDGISHRAIGGGQRGGLTSLATIRRTVQQVIQAHKRKPFDVVHAFWADEPGLVAVWVARRIGRPAVVSLGGGELIYLRDIGYGTAGSLFRRQMVRLVLRGATAVTAGSQYQAGLARAWGLAIERLVVAPLGVDLGRFGPANGSGAGAPTIIQAASLTPVKGQRFLLELFHRLRGLIPACRLVVAGDGPLQRRLKEEGSRLNFGENVRWAGAVPYAEMPEFYRQAHLYVQSSRHESQGMSVLEAMASGLPVAGTPVGLLPEVSFGEPGWNVGELAGQIAEALSDQIAYDGYRRQALRRVAEEFSLEAAVSRFQKLYDSL